MISIMRPRLQYRRKTRKKIEKIEFSINSKIKDKIKKNHLIKRIQNKTN